MRCKDCNTEISAKDLSVCPYCGSKNLAADNEIPYTKVLSHKEKVAEIRKETKKILKRNLIVLFPALIVSAVVFSTVGSALFHDLGSGILYKPDGLCEICGKYAPYTVYQSTTYTPLLDLCTEHAVAYAWGNLLDFTAHAYVVKIAVFIVWTVFFFAFQVLFYKIHQRLFPYIK